MLSFLSPFLTFDDFLSPFSGAWPLIQRTIFLFLFLYKRAGIFYFSGLFMFVFGPRVRSEAVEEEFNFYA